MEANSKTFIRERYSRVTLRLEDAGIAWGSPYSVNCRAVLRGRLARPETPTKRRVVANLGWAYAVCLLCEYSSFKIMP